MRCLAMCKFRTTFFPVNSKARKNSAALELKLQQPLTVLKPPTDFPLQKKVILTKVFKNIPLPKTMHVPSRDP